MAPPPTAVGATSSRWRGIETKLTASVNALEIISTAVQTPFLKPIYLTIQSILTIVKAAKQQKNEALLLLEQTHQLLLVVISLYIKPTEGQELPPTIMGEVANFASILHKIYSVLAAQQEGSRIWKFFRQGELNTMLKECNASLEHCLSAFKVKSAELLQSVIELDVAEDATHQEVLDLVASVSDASSDGASTVTRVLSTAYNSSTSLSLLPSEPKIFHGRESELSQILDAFKRESPRIVILGAGGMGKTSLSRAVLHHPDIVGKYADCRVFVACDSASTQAELLPLLGAHIGIGLRDSVVGRIVRYFSNSAPTLLVLDNLETVWESDSRKEVEDLLSRLTDIRHLALIVTMRGAERPDKVKWSQPFLPPLQPLAHAAARQTFLEIADANDYTEREIQQVLELTDNMPLAIDLIAHLVDSESCAIVLSRFEDEKTSLLSEGYDKRSNLDMSISISLSSARITAVPSAMHLLSLLSLLPDGITDAELLQSHFPAANILECKRALLRTSLAYITTQRRLKVLVPIREHIQKQHPPDADFVNPIFHNYRQLLEVYAKYRGTIESSEMVAQIASNFANIQNVISFTMHHPNADQEATISCANALHMFARLTGDRKIPLMAELLQQLPPNLDPRLEVSFIAEYMAFRTEKIPNIERLIQRASDKLPLNDPIVESQFYLGIGNHYMARDITKAEHFVRKALQISTSTNDPAQKAQAYTILSRIQFRLGDYKASCAFAEKAQITAAVAGDLLRQSRAMTLESTSQRELGNYSDCVALDTRAKSLLALCGLSGGEIEHHIDINSAEVHKIKSEYREALAIQQDLEEHSPPSHPYLRAIAFLNFAELGILMEAPAVDVQANIDGARKTFAELGIDQKREERAICDATQGDLWLREGNITGAEEVLRSCWGETWGFFSPAADFCLERLANAVRWGAGSERMAQSVWLVLFLAQSMLSKQKLGVFKSLQFFGDAALLLDDELTAESLLIVALDGFTQMDIHCSRGQCMLSLGTIANKRGESVKARRYWEMALPLFERSSQTSTVEVVQGLLFASKENVE